MGIGDAGTSTGGGGPYSSDSFVGAATIDTVATYNSSLGSQHYGFSLQLNAFLDFSYGGTAFVYWAQSVAGIDSATDSITFFDNVWNATSSPLPQISSSAISGNGNVSTFSGGSYYGDAASCALPGACTVLTLPANVSLRLNASLSGSGEPMVSFAYNDGFGFQTFDAATFVFAHGVTGFPGFVVTSSEQGSGCLRCYGDVEFVLGGPAGGANTSLSGPTGIFLDLAFWNGNDYEAVPSALDHGFATEEGLSSATVTLAAAGNGSPLAEVTAGAGQLGTLWSPSAVATVEVSIASGTSGGTVTVGASPPSPFVGTLVTEEFVPGTYSVSVISGGVTYALGTLVLTAGEELTLEVGAPAVVFVPGGLPATTVWSVTLRGQTLSGTGNITFGEAAGTYSFSVGTLTGYAADPSSGNVNVSASGATVGIQWSSTARSWLQQLEALLLLRVGPVPLYFVLLLLVVGGILAAAISSASRPPSTPWRPSP